MKLLIMGMESLMLETGNVIRFHLTLSDWV